MYVSSAISLISENISFYPNNNLIKKLAKGRPTTHWSNKNIILKIENKSINNDYGKKKKKNTCIYK